MALIRAAVLREMDEVGKIYHTVWEETQAGLQPPAVREFRTRQYFYNRVTSRANSALVAISGGTIVGFQARII